MQLWNIGDTSQAVCTTCRKLVSTTFATRSVRLERSRVTVPDVLVAVCDRCGATVGIPAQSEPRLKEARERAPAKVIARVNRRLDDALRLIAATLGGRDRDLRSPLIKYYLTLVGNDPRTARRVAALAQSPLAEGQKTSRVEIRLPAPIFEAAWSAAKVVGVRTRTELVAGVIAAAAEDVLDARAPKRRAELERLAAIA